MSDTDKGLAAFFTDQHRRCDTLWGEVEAAVERRDEAVARQCWARFDKSMRHHFDIEEGIMFPAFEDATGMHGGGPTMVMRMEHERMRNVLDQMAGLANEDLEALADLGDTLLMIIQQHNVKEEGILYAAADQTLAAQWPTLAEKIAERHTAEMVEDA